MGFRVVSITSHSKLEYSMNFLIFKTVDSVKKVLLDEINTLIIDSTAVAITSALINELIAHKIDVIFCDDCHNPSSQLLPFYGSYNSYKKINEQIHWKKEYCDLVWKELIIQKIKNQAYSCASQGKKTVFEQLLLYSTEVLPGDKTNREGHAAKVYFNNIYGTGFTRGDDGLINACLNYGYTIILSFINRTVVSYGYLTQIGIHHFGETNPFNFSSDLIEPLRFIVDEEVFIINTSQESFKEHMINLLNKEVLIDNKRQTLSNAIPIYFLSIIEAIKSGKVNNIKFISKIGNYD